MSNPCSKQLALSSSSDTSLCVNLQSLLNSAAYASTDLPSWVRLMNCFSNSLYAVLGKNRSKKPFSNCFHGTGFFCVASSASHQVWATSSNYIFTISTMSSLAILAAFARFSIFRNHPSAYRGVPLLEKVGGCNLLKSETFPVLASREVTTLFTARDAVCWAVSTHVCRRAV